ncbi:hypothetical protein N9D27_01875 [Gammaproteobacteria bacterium]|nr:hypothetical protein [Gammaproteobacteria bacterium]
MARHRGTFKPEHAEIGFGPKGDKPCEYSVLFESMNEHNLS